MDSNYQSAIISSELYVTFMTLRGIFTVLTMMSIDGPRQFQRQTRRALSFFNSLR